MNIGEITSGSLPNPNIPDFSNAAHECDIDGYHIMFSVFNGYHALGVLDEKNKPKSYILVEPEQNGYCKLREIYTTPEYRGQNLAATLLLCLKSKLGIKLLLTADEVLSKDARGLILKMVGSNRLAAKLEDGINLNYNELKDIFDNTTAFKKGIILEGQDFMNWERRYRKDELLSERWRLRGTDNIIRELYND